MEIDWKEVNVTFNGNKMSLPKSVTINLEINSKLDMMKREPLCFHIMLRPGFNWFTLASNNPPTETV